LRAGLAVLRADSGALPFFVDNAARWSASFRRTQATSPAATLSTRPT
jgi:hypothetical protein